MEQKEIASSKEAENSSNERLIGQINIAELIAEIRC